jgi:uncharacterized protein (TIGR04255 family)
MSTEDCPITYENPPIVEVAISTQFEPPRGLTQAHLGAYWADCRRDYPQVHATQVLPATTEEFGGRRTWLPPSLRLALTDEPDSRIQMTSEDSTWMLQVQSNRIVVNWRRKADLSDPYPRFTGTWQRFENAWEHWCRFLATAKIPAPQPTHWEIVYVNRIGKGTLWNKPTDWPSVLPGLWGHGFADIPGTTLMGLHGQWVWETTNPPTRLFIEPKPGRGPAPRSDDFLFLNITARGKIDLSPSGESSDDSCLLGIENGIKAGRRLIVNAFDQIISQKAKAEWKRHGD